MAVPRRLADAQDQLDKLASAVRAGTAQQVARAPDTRAQVLAGVLWNGAGGGSVGRARTAGAGLVDFLVGGRGPALQPQADAEQQQLEQRVEDLRAQGLAVKKIAGRWMRPSFSAKQQWTPVLGTRELVQQRLYRAELAARQATNRYAQRIGVPPRQIDRTGTVEWGEPRLERFWAAQTATAAGRIAHDATVDSWRDGAFERMAQRREVRGWRRLAEPTACGACLALADGKLHPVMETRFYRHNHCQCIPVAVTATSPRVPTGQEIFDAKTVDEQNAVFRGHGGRAKAQALRDGTIALADLVRIDEDRIDRTDYVLAEAPLSAVLATAS
jgi:hypothetical protein